MPSECIRKSN